MATGFRIIEQRFADILANLPSRFVAVVLKFLIQPFGARVTGPSDATVHACAQLVLEPSVARDRLTPNLSHVDDDKGVARLEKAFMLVTAAEDISKRMRAAHLHDPAVAVKQGVMQPDILVLDTDVSRIDGSGRIDLGQERLDLTMVPKSRKLSLVALHTPIHVQGSFAHP